MSEEIKRYINDQGREACEPMLDEMRATNELLPLFPGSEQMPEVDWNDEDNVRVSIDSPLLLVPEFVSNEPAPVEEIKTEEPKKLKAKLYQLGPDEIGEYYRDTVNKYQWIVYWYEYQPYEGSGNAITWDGSTLRYHNLSHCSCYGPEDGLDDGDVVTVEDLTSESVLDQYREDLVEKALELMGIVVIPLKKTVEFEFDENQETLACDQCNGREFAILIHHGKILGRRCVECGKRTGDWNGWPEGEKTT